MNQVLSIYNLAKKEPQDNFMTTVKAHITKLLSVLVLLLLGLVVATLEKQLGMKSDWHAGMMQ